MGMKLTPEQVEATKKLLESMNTLLGTTVFALTYNETGEYDISAVFEKYGVLVCPPDNQVAKE